MKALCLWITNCFRIIILVNIWGIQIIFWIVVFFPDFMSVYAQIRSNALARSLQGWVLQSWITHNRYYLEKVVWLTTQSLWVKGPSLWVKGPAFIRWTPCLHKLGSYENEWASIWRLQMQVLCVYFFFHQATKKIFFPMLNIIIDFFIFFFFLQAERCKFDQSVTVHQK